MDLMSTDVMDECDIAAALEEAERAASIKRIRHDMPGDRDIEQLIVEDLQCEMCAAVIPVARQRVVLTIHKTCDLCVDCQSVVDKKEKMFNV